MHCQTPPKPNPIYARRTGKTLIRRRSENWRSQLRRVSIDREGQLEREVGGATTPGQEITHKPTARRCETGTSRGITTAVVGRQSHDPTLRKSLRKAFLDSLIAGPSNKKLARSEAAAKLCERRAISRGTQRNWVNQCQSSGPTHIYHTKKQSEFHSEALRSCCSRRQVQAPIARVSQGSDCEPRT